MEDLIKERIYEYRKMFTEEELKKIYDEIGTVEKVYMMAITEEILKRKRDNK